MKDIQGTDGNFLSYFRQFISNGELKEEHQRYLFNAQDCKNKFNSGGPKDPLETTTKRPRCNNKSNNNDNNDDAVVGVASLMNTVCMLCMSYLSSKKQFTRRFYFFVRTLFYSTGGMF